MRRTTITPEALLIPLCSLLLTFALGMTPWGSTFTTIPSFSREENIAAVRLSGFLKPKVTMGIAESEKGVWVRMGVEGGKEGIEGKVGKVGIIIPASWELEEVRGVHVREVRTKDLGLGTREFTFPYPLPNTPYQIQLLFTTEEPFDSLHFSHDSESPALLKLTRLQYPEGKPEQILKFVKDSVTLLL